MLTKEQSRQRWRELRDLVNVWDPIGLIAAGAPHEEYECVVGPTMRLLEQDAPHQAMVAFLTGEFRDHFAVPIAESVVDDFVARAMAWYQGRWRPVI